MEVNRALKRAINLPTMPNSQEMNYILARIECVNHVVITDPKPKAVDPCEAVMGKGRKTNAHLIDGIFDASPDVGRELKKRSIKPGVVYLERRAHSTISGFAHARLAPCFHFDFRLANGVFKFRREFQFVLEQVIQPLADLSKPGGRELFQLSLDLLNFAHRNRMPHHGRDFNFRTLRSLTVS